MKHLLLVHHSQTGTTATMAQAVMDGARDAAIEGVELRVASALVADVEDLRWADAVILGTPENFAYMSGALKYFFDRIYYPCLKKPKACLMRCSSRPVMMAAARCPASGVLSPACAGAKCSHR